MGPLRFKRGSPQPVPSNASRPARCPGPGFSAAGHTAVLFWLPACSFLDHTPRFPPALLAALRDRTATTVLARAPPRYLTVFLIDRYTNIICVSDILHINIQYMIYKIYDIIYPSYITQIYVYNIFSSLLGQRRRGLPVQVVGGVLGDGAHLGGVRAGSEDSGPVHSPHGGRSGLYVKPCRVGVGGSPTPLVSEGVPPPPLLCRGEKKSGASRRVCIVRLNMKFLAK